VLLVEFDVILMPELKPTVTKSMTAVLELNISDDELAVLREITELKDVTVLVEFASLITVFLELRAMIYPLFNSWSR